jgi:hypothetical protein
VSRRTRRRLLAVAVGALMSVVVTACGVPRERDAREVPGAHLVTPKTTTTTP